MTHFYVVRLECLTMTDTIYYRYAGQLDSGEFVKCCPPYKPKNGLFSTIPEAEYFRSILPLEWKRSIYIRNIAVRLYPNPPQYCVRGYFILPNGCKIPKYGYWFNGLVRVTESHFPIILLTMEQAITLKQELNTTYKTQYGYIRDWEIIQFR